jgi:L-amino acid N-acyltransferase YncA
MTDSLNIRDAVADDMKAIQAIYADHVAHGLASFEEVPPNVYEMVRRFQSIKEDGYPYRVAEWEGSVRGYSYAGKYRPRPAYRPTVENSIYVDAEFSGKGIGRALLEDLIGLCTEMGFRQMIAVIGDSANQASINLHASCGFENVGVMRSLAFKHGQWIDQVLMQRTLGEGDKSPP